MAEFFFDAILLDNSGFTLVLLGLLDRLQIESTETSFYFLDCFTTFVNFHLELFIQQFVLLLGRCWLRLLWFFALSTLNLAKHEIELTL